MTFSGVFIADDLLDLNNSPIEEHNMMIQYVCEIYYFKKRLCDLLKY